MKGTATEIYNSYDNQQYINSVLGIVINNADDN